MSVSKPSQDEAGKRNLPSWMNKGESSVKKPATGAGESEESSEGERSKQVKGHSKRGSGSKEMDNNKKSSASTSSSGTGNFSKLLVIHQKMSVIYQLALVFLSFELGKLIWYYNCVV